MTGSDHLAVDSAGVLQITWLLGREPHLADVARPELQALRAAGMFDVQMGVRDAEYGATRRRSAWKSSLDSTDNFVKG